MARRPTTYFVRRMFAIRCTVVYVPVKSSCFLRLRQRILSTDQLKPTTLPYLYRVVTTDMLASKNPEYHRDCQDLTPATGSSFRQLSKLQTVQ